ncbi:MAG: glucosaminidase domain-containing protein [Bacteroidales bacterium]|nr:glucosaminidase domain-containing protein [Bacteroidales bacterium]
MSFRKYLTLLFCLSIFSLQAQTRLRPYDEYINKYAGIAVAQQNIHAIPASITLAQGLLESGAGKSDMAKQSNNHFGIKCHNSWKGETVTFFDDSMNSCFRKYDSVEDSYEDHSQFLVQGKRYAPLFQLDVTDYKGWANGLQKAGYATDRTYAEKLIRVIETYQLNDYTKGKTAKQAEEKATRKTRAEKRAEKAALLNMSNSEKRAAARAKNLNNDALKNAKDYHSIEYRPAEEVINPLTSHEILYRGTTPYIVAQYGDSFSGLSDEFGISGSRIRSINEFSGNYTLTPGELVYLDKKNNWWEGEYPLHRVQAGDTMHSIAQKYGLQLKALYKLNEMKPGDSIKIGQKIKLRNPEQMSRIVKAMTEAFNKKDSIQ